MPMTLVDRPMSTETDEIKLRQKFYYKQAYFYKSAALFQQGIPDLIWVEDNIDEILNSAALQTHTDKEDVYESRSYCLNIKYREKASSQEFSPLHSKDAQEGDDAIEVPVNSTTNHGEATTSEDIKHQIEEERLRNPYKEDTVQEEIVGDNVEYQPCLVEFTVWRASTSLIDGVVPSVSETIEEAGDVALDAVMGYDAKKDCEEGNVEGQNGIFYNDTCHYYSVLERLCVQIGFDPSSEQQPIYYDKGCYRDLEPTLYKNAESGKYYDFSSAVSIELRSNLDPYMVFAFTRDNLGTDFTIFFYMSIFALHFSAISLCIVMYYYCCAFKKLDPNDRNHDLHNRTATPHSEFDSELEFKDYRNRNLN